MVDVLMRNVEDLCKKASNIECYEAVTQCVLLNSKADAFPIWTLIENMRLEFALVHFHTGPT